MVFWQYTGAEEGGPEWAVVCPGPSLDGADVSRFAYMPTIAVDGAAAAPALEYDFWASWDRPRAVHERCLERARVCRPSIITRWQVAGAWEDLVDCDVSIPSAPLEPVVIAQHDKHDPIPPAWRYAHLDRAPSWLLAIRFALFRGLAQKIHLVGLDLAGEGYALGLPDDRKRGPDEWEGRWLGERAMLKAATELCTRAGVIVLRHLAGPVLDASVPGEC